MAPFPLLLWGVAFTGCVVCSFFYFPNCRLKSTLKNNHHIPHPHRPPPPPPPPTPPPPPPHHHHHQQQQQQQQPAAAAAAARNFNNAIVISHHYFCRLIDVYILDVRDHELFHTYTYTICTSPQIRICASSNLKVFRGEESVYLIEQTLNTTDP